MRSPLPVLRYFHSETIMLITARYRIHINSIDLNGTSARCCGGIGFAVRRPALKLRIERNTTDAVNTSHGVATEDFLRLAREVEGGEFPLRIEEVEGARPHIGLGSFTQLKLSVLRAIRLYRGARLEEGNIPPALRIGATSGVGLGTFLYGGLIVDGGYRIGHGVQKVINGEAAGKSAPIIARWDVPDDWGVLLALPRALRSLSGREEAEFFDSITPVPRSEAREISYHILLGALPALRERDFEGFVSAVKLVCEMGTKPHELKLNPSCIPVVQALEAAFGFGGVSSLGPTCYAFFERSRLNDETVRDLELRFPDFEWICTECCNEPHEVQLDDDVGTHSL
jgi:beta-ribofuranosylaminobenzene 5'-phosphate synthase